MTYTSDLLYHANKLFKKKEIENRDVVGSLEDVLICCDDGRSFKYSKILFTFFLQSYYGYSNLDFIEECDVIVVSSHDIGSLLYLINFFYAFHHDQSCYLCKVGSSVLKHMSNCERKEEENISMVARDCEDPDGSVGMASLEKCSDDGLVIEIEGSMNLGVPVLSIEQKPKAITGPSGVEVLKYEQPIDILKQLKPQEGSQNLKEMCENCGLTYETTAQLRNHYYEKHSIKKPNHQCEICKKMYKRLRDLNKHLVSHSKIRKFKCLECGSEFKRSQDLKKHKVDHDGMKFVCEICSIEIKHERSYKRHMSGHEAKKYECPKCQKHFHRKDKLAVHQRTCRSTAEYNGC